RYSHRLIRQAGIRHFGPVCLVAAFRDTADAMVDNPATAIVVAAAWSRCISAPWLVAGRGPRNPIGRRQPRVDPTCKYPTRSCHQRIEADTTRHRSGRPGGEIV